MRTVTRKTKSVEVVLVGDAVRDVGFGKSVLSVWLLLRGPVGWGVTSIDWLRRAIAPESRPPHPRRPFRSRVSRRPSGRRQGLLDGCVGCGRGTIAGTCFTIAWCTMWVGAVARPSPGRSFSVYQREGGRR